MRDGQVTGATFYESRNQSLKAVGLEGSPAVGTSKLLSPGLLPDGLPCFHYEPFGGGGCALARMRLVARSSREHRGFAVAGQIGAVLIGSTIAAIPVGLG